MRKYYGRKLSPVRFAPGQPNRKPPAADTTEGDKTQMQATPMNTDATPVKPAINPIAESFALWVEVVTNIASFFAERADGLSDWKPAGPPCASLVQLFPASGELRDNTDIAKRAALAIGGTWVRERESYGESWRGNVALADGYTFQVCLHYVIRRPFGSGEQIDLSADAATAAAKEVSA